MAIFFEFREEKRANSANVRESFRKTLGVFGREMCGIGEEYRGAFARVERDRGSEVGERIEDVAFGVFERAIQCERTTERLSAPDERFSVGLEAEEVLGRIEKYPVHEKGEVCRVVEESSVIEKGEPLFRKFRTDEHVAESLMIGIAEPVKEENDIN